MSHTALLALGVFALGLFVSAGLLYRQVQQQDKLAARIAAVKNGSQPIKETGPKASLPSRIISGVGNSILRSGFLPGKTVTELEQTLISAGFRSTNGIGLFLGCKVLALVLCPVLGLQFLNWAGYTGLPRIAGLAVMLVIGMLAPDFTVKFLRRRYLDAVERGLPDALDMMVICAEAGLALEPAVTRVGKEIAPAHPNVSAEFLLTASELRIVSDHRFALNQMGLRTGLIGLKRLTTTLVQTLQYGTPLTDALRVLSSEMRGEMLTRFEARAARLPVLLTIPMIVFILPCVFLVVGGPAIIQVIRVFKG